GLDAGVLARHGPIIDPNLTFLVPAEDDGAVTEWIARTQARPSGINMHQARVGFSLHVRPKRPGSDDLGGVGHSHPVPCPCGRKSWSVSYLGRRLHTGSGLSWRARCTDSE